MSTSFRNIVLLSRGVFKARDIDIGDFEKKVAALGEVDEVRLIDSWQLETLGSYNSHDRLFLAGRAEVVPDLVDEASQFPVDILGQTAWLAGDRGEAALTLIKSAVNEAGLQAGLERESVESVPQVLVCGSGRAAEKTVDRLAGLGIKTIWALPGNNGVEKETDPLVEIVSGATIESINGSAGRFTVVLKENGSSMEVKAGAIVLCGSAESSPSEFQAGGDSMTLSEFEAVSSNGARPEWAGNADFKLAFITGFGFQTSNGSMKRIMEAACRAASETMARVFVLAPQIKVASYGLERLYGQARNLGVTFIRTPDEGPALVESNGEKVYKIFDAAARADLILKPDLAVVDHPAGPSTGLAGLAEKASLSTGPDGFIGPDNVLFLPAQTSRPGVYSLGPVRGADSEEALEAQISGTLSDIERLFNSGIFEGVYVSVDENLCAHCLSCLRICPLGAISFDCRPWFDPASCAACGLCAARCPAKAITLWGATDDQVNARLKTMLSRTAQGEFEPRLVVFGCKRSAETAMKKTFGPDFPVDLTMIPIPCGGRLDDGLVLKAFLDGADGVMAAVCHQDNCRTHEGCYEAERRAANIRTILDETGFQSERFRLETLAPNMEADFIRMASDFRNDIKALGPSALAGAGRGADND